MKVLSFGEVLWDIINDVPHLGGAPLNFAAHTVQCGGEAAILSRLGEDALGRDAASAIEKVGVKTDLLQWDSVQATGTVPVQLINGQPDYLITPDVAYDYISFEEARSALASGAFEVLYFGTLAQRGLSSTALRKIIESFEFKLRFYDINLRKDCYTKENIEWSLDHADVVKLNEDEVVEIGEMMFGKSLSKEQFVDELAQAYPKLEHIVLTAGGDGCFVKHQGQLTHIPSEPVKVKDAIGAGDSFSASFLYTFFKTGDMLQSAQVGNKVGGFVASSSGAIPPYSEEIKAVIGAL